MSLRPTSLIATLVLALLLAAPLAGQAARKPHQAAKGQLTIPKLKPARPATTLVPGINAWGELDSRDPVLADKTPYEAWWYAGKAGEVLLVTMRATRADAYVMLLRRRGNELDTIAENDDGLGAGTTDAGLRITLPADGDYLIIANSAATLGPDYFYGKYVLEVASSLDSSEANWAALYPGGGSPGDRYAVVVGIADYPGEKYDLVGPRQDAAMFRESLIEKYDFKPENIITLTDRNGNREQIINTFRRFLSQAGPNGTAVFYFSGSGTQLGSNLVLTGADDPEDDGKDEGLVVWDRGGNDMYSLVVDDELLILADELNAGRVLLVLDACYSGTGSRAPRGLPKFIRFKDIKATTELPKSWVTSSGPNTGLPSPHILLAAASDKEVAWTGNGWPTRGGLASVFTYYLVDALNRVPPGTTVDQLMQIVGPETNQFATANFARTQTPWAEGARVGEPVAEYLGWTQ
jgi:Caspase domain